LLPKCGGEGDVDFFKAAVGDIVNGLEETRGKRKVDGKGVVFVAFEPA
jgi:hypothetical protein